VTLIVLGALAFALQQPAYVFEQYQRWFSARASYRRGIIMNIGMVLKAVYINLSSNEFVAAKYDKENSRCR
jgi:hypothetical protein